MTIQTSRGEIQQQAHCPLTMKHVSLTKPLLQARSRFRYRKQTKHQQNIHYIFFQKVRAPSHKVQSTIARCTRVILNIGRKQPGCLRLHLLQHNNNSLFLLLLRCRRRRLDGRHHENGCPPLCHNRPCSSVVSVLATCPVSKHYVFDSAAVDVLLSYLHGHISGSPNLKIPKTKPYHAAGVC